MNNFIFQNPVKLIMGKGMISELANEIPAGKRIMVTFGGGSVKKNNVYNQVTKALEGFHTVEFWGIEANPTIETLRKAIALGKKEKIDFLLAVGGGSVIDGTKLISAGLLYEGDAWDLVLAGHETNTVPLATVLTLPATGSEMNAGAVISNTATKEKFSFFSNYPLFSILDPETTFTLPDNQIANGLADTFVHVMEQYLTVPGVSRLMDRWAEGILQTVIEIAPLIQKDKHNYDLMAEFMLSATMGLNGFVALGGVPQDWATHMIGHELTALHGLSHGHTLAIILPGTMNILRESKGDKIIQYGERVWGITGGTRDERINQAITKTDQFFRSLGLTTRLSEENIGTDTINEIERRFNERGAAFGENQTVNGKIAKKILSDRL
ncbi:MAG: iron-containing alcohol dehydrogenase [Tannerellaceae bacterium]|nr:iron-containing alcohol dehydrogenase [Tannerellaceae bacterium]